MTKKPAKKEKVESAKEKMVYKPKAPVLEAQPEEKKEIAADA